MKSLFTYGLLLFSLAAYGQLLENGSFESDDLPTLEGWTDQCNAGISAMEAAPDGGLWSLQLPPGNTQGCFPGYFYQPVTIDPLVTYRLSAWVKTALNTPARIHFGRIDELEQITPTLTDTTTNAAWTFLEIQGTFNYEDGEQPAVLLSGGLTGGPAFPGYASFDLVQLEPINTTTEPELPKIHVFPNPSAEEVYVHWSHSRLQLQATQVVDLQGTRYPVEWTASGKNSYILKMGHLPEGLYVLQLISDGGRFSEKLVKIRHGN